MSQARRIAAGLAERVEKLDTLSQKCKHFFDKMQSVTRTRFARTLTD